MDYSHVKFDFVLFLYQNIFLHSVWIIFRVAFHRAHVTCNTFNAYRMVRIMRLFLWTPHPLFLIYNLHIIFLFFSVLLFLRSFDQRSIDDFFRSKFYFTIFSMHFSFHNFALLCHHHINNTFLQVIAFVVLWDRCRCRCLDCGWRWFFSSYKNHNWSACECVHLSEWRAQKCLQQWNSIYTLASE